MTTAYQEKTEYNYLLDFFLGLSQFEPMTSTFFYLKDNEKRELNLTISILQKKLSEIMPKVQDRELSKQSEIPHV